MRDRNETPIDPIFYPKTQRWTSRNEQYVSEGGKLMITRPFGLNFAARNGYPFGKKTDGAK